MLNHTDCPHPATKADRAACRKAHAEAAHSREVCIQDLIEVFNERSAPRPNHWVWYAARRFASYEGEDLHEAADAILTYFYPSGDEAKDNRRLANGYIITDSHYRMLQITLRAAS